MDFRYIIWICIKKEINSDDGSSNLSDFTKKGDLILYNVEIFVLKNFLRKHMKEKTESRVFVINIHRIVKKNAADLLKIMDLIK